MTESPAPPTPPLPRRLARWRIITARTLTVIGILLVVVSVLANYVKRTALDEGNFRGTARALIADDKIRNQVASTLVERLYANTDVAATLRQRLPDNLRPLAVPIAGLVQNATESAAKQLLARPRVQNLFVNASSLAQRQFVALLNDDKNVLRTTNGDVVLDLQPILERLGQRFSVANRIPPDAGRITLLHSDQLKTGQRATRALRFVADWIWALALAAWIAAILLVPGRRRLEVRAIAIGILAAGFLILLLRSWAGRYVVNNLVASDTVRPSARDAYTIITTLLKGAGWTGVIVGAVALVGVWLTGAGRYAVTARKHLAPHLRGAGIYAVTIGGFLLLLWWRPTPQFGYWVNIIIFFVALMIGTEVLRRQLAREHPAPSTTVSTPAT
jgi:hypothetical protein